MNTHTKHSLCILTTVSASIKAFYKGQIEALNEAGFKTTVVCANDEKLKELLPKETTYHPVLFSRVISPFQDVKAIYQLYKLFRKEKFDIVQYSTPKASLLGSIAAFLAKVPIRIYILWGLYYTGQEGTKRFIFKSFEKIISKLSNKIIPISHKMVDFAVSEGFGKRTKYKVMLNGSACGVDMNLFVPEKWAHCNNEIRGQLQLPDNGVVIGTVARLTGDKGINELVQAFDRLSQEIPRIYLLLVGEQEEKDRLSPSTESIISQNPRIRTVGWKDNPLPYYAAMDIFCLPTYREGFGEVNLEAQAMGLPVVSTNVIGPSESVEDGATGVLVPAKDTNALIAPLKKLILDSGLRKEMGNHGIERVKQLFDRKAMIEAIVKHRLSLLEKSKLND